eukprot:11728198-Karenia_brevis.AAC.1
MQSRNSVGFDGVELWVPISGRHGRFGPGTHLFVLSVLRGGEGGGTRGRGRILRGGGEGEGGGE